MRLSIIPARVMAVAVVSVALVPVAHAQTSTSIPMSPTTSTSLVSSTTMPSSSSTTSTTLQPGTPTALDALFATDAPLIDIDEVLNGQLASKAGEDQAVQTYGEDMVRDHCAHLEQVLAAVRAAGIPLPPQAESSPCGSSASGAFAAPPDRDFDTMYAKQQITGHKQALDLYRREVNSGEDEGLRTLASQTIPTLRQHLRNAKRLVRQLGGTGGNGNGGGGGGSGGNRM